MESIVNECVFGELPRNIFKKGSFSNSPSEATAYAPTTSAPESGRSALATACPSLADSSSSRALGTSADTREFADLRAQVSSLAGECEQAVKDADMARQQVSEIHEWVKLLYELNPVQALSPKRSIYSGEPEAYSPHYSQLSSPSLNSQADATSVHALLCCVREQMHLIKEMLSSFDSRLNAAEGKSMAARSEMLNVSNKLVEYVDDNLRREVLKAVADFENQVLANTDSVDAGERVDNGGLTNVLDLPESTPVSLALSGKLEELKQDMTQVRTIMKEHSDMEELKDVVDPGNKLPASRASPLLSCDAGELVRLGLHQLRHNGGLAKVLDLPESTKVSLALAGELEELKNDVTQIRTIVKEHSDKLDMLERVRNLRSEPESAQSPMSAQSPNTPRFALKAVRERLHSLELKHSLPRC